MKIKYLTGLFLLAAAQASFAALTLNIVGNPNSGSFFVTSNNTTRVADGSLVRIGTFETAPDPNSTFEQLAAQFTEFATTTIGHSAAAGANKGMINRTNIVDGPNQPGDSFFAGKQVYIWVYNSATADATADQGIFTSTDAAWRFAASADDPPVSLSTSLINTAIGVGLTAPGINPAADGVAQNYRLAAVVPEVSSSALAMLGIALIGARRRK